MTRQSGLKDSHVIIAGGALIAFLAYSKKKSIGLLNYFIGGIGITFSGATPIMRIDIGIQNPTNNDFTIKSFVGNLTANGYLIGNVSSFNQVFIRSNAQVYYSIIVRMNLIGIVSDIINLIQQGSGVSQEIILQGSVNASGIVAPVELKYKIL